MYTCLVRKTDFLLRPQTPGSVHSSKLLYPGVLQAASKAATHAHKHTQSHTHPITHVQPLTFTRSTHKHTQQLAPKSIVHLVAAPRPGYPPDERPFYNYCNNNYL